MNEDELYTNDELDELLFEHSEEVCGFHGGNQYEQPTRIYDWRMEKLIREYKALKQFYLEQKLK
ncbi:hypothetical protein [Paenibacillus oryzisoli]|uniref:Uncharacterized protein n=1 Tax=Paenibacillus oryzisoli TaxID=1850517 RepID=A0A197ZX43_9BACL|nr:hypothetical protein [Paenibacillus oryzisoli]OAS13734.1 hypothetical protein A8708_25165 [Paenibacillus oryzisoli]